MTRRSFDRSGVKDNSGNRIRLFGAGADLARRFELQEVVSRSATGSAVTAFDKERHQLVHMELHSTFRLTRPAHQYLADARILSSLPSRRIVPVLEAGVSGTTLFVISEYPPGVSLKERIEAGPLSVSSAIKLAIEIAEGLRFLHEAGVLHRNLEPGSIFVDGDSGARLGRAGLEERWEDNETAAAFLAPEQSAHGIVRETSDLYSLGAVLFAMLTKSPPLSRTTPLETVVTHIKRRAPDVRTIRRDVPAWLARIIARLLERDESLRYPGAEAVLADLRTHRVPPRFLRSRRVHLAAAASTAFLAVALVLHPSWDWNRPRLAVLASDERGGAVASDATGLVLWSRPDLFPEGRAVLIDSGRFGKNVAAILGGGRTRLTQEHFRTLSYLDGRTGAVTRSVALPVPAVPDQSVLEIESVLVGAQTAGLREDTAITVTFTANNGSFSWTVVHSLASFQPYIAFQSPWLHIPIGTLEADGSRLLLLAGKNGDAGGYTGIAAVALEPWGQAPVTSPESVPERDPSRFPIFYAISAAKRIPGIYATRKALEYETFTSRLSILDIHGFLRRCPTAIPQKARADLRKRTFLKLQMSASAAARDRLLEARSLSLEARDSAATASDPALSELVSRHLTVLELPRTGTEQADQSFQILYSRSDAPALIALEAASLFHGEGSVNRAWTWYEKGLESCLEGKGDRETARSLFDGARILAGTHPEWPGAAAILDRATALTRGMFSWRITRSGVFQMGPDSFNRWVKTTPVVSGYHARLRSSRYPPVRPNSGD